MYGGDRRLRGAINVGVTRQNEQFQRVFVAFRSSADPIEVAQNAYEDLNVSSLQLFPSFAWIFSALPPQCTEPTSAATGWKQPSSTPPPTHTFTQNSRGDKGLKC